MTRTIFAAALCLQAVSLHALDAREWGEIGKADAEGWAVPAKLPKGEDRVLAECEGMPKGRVANVTGYVRSEFDFDPADMGKKPGGYVELYLKGLKGMVNGNYNRKYPADGKVVTEKVLVMDFGTEAAFGVLKSDGEPKKVNPLRSRLVSTAMTAVLRAPDDGAVLSDNTPDLAWYTEDPLGVTLELSRDPTFPEAATRRRERRDQIPFLTWDEPLEPGVWHWRVTTGSGYTTGARSFRQTAAKAADCTPPAIECEPRFMPDPDRPYGFEVGEDAVRVSAVLRGEKGDVPLDARHKGRRAGARPPQGGWPAGVSRVLLTAEDARGNVSRATAWVSSAPGLPLVTWGGAGGRLTIDGEPFDLVAIYGVDRIADIGRVKGLGFNCVHSYSRDSNMTTPKSAAFLDALEAQGMKTFVSVNRDNVRRGQYSQIAEKIGSLLPRKCLLAWYLSDEPETHDFRPVTPRAFRRYSDFVKALDPTRPRIVSHNVISCGAQRYVGTADIHFSQLYKKTLAETKGNFASHRKWFDEFRPELKYSIIVNPRAAESAEALAEEIAYGRAHGCGIVFYAWFEALGKEATMGKLERGMELSGLTAAARGGVPPDPEGRRLLWHDEFDGDALDTRIWQKCKQYKDAWNRYMSDREDLVQVRDGTLVMSGVANSDTNADPRPFLTGGVRSNGKGLMQLGKAEMRVRFEDQKGAWPALWMLGDVPDAQGRRWPWNGEIDIVERLNSDPFMYQTVHTGWTYVHKHKDDPPHAAFKVPIRQGGWNVYGLEITPDALIWYVNGTETFRYPRTQESGSEQWPFVVPMHFLMDMQLGGNWAGEVDASTLPVRMYVDWIRVWGEKPREPVIGGTSPLIFRGE